MAYPVTIHRKAAEQPALPWSTFWSQADGLGDWKLEAAADPLNPGGLSDDSQIATAIIVSLFTDRLAPDGWRPDVSDRRGWWGDGVAPEGEALEPLGSHLWLLKNEVATERVAGLAKVYAEEALAWLVAERVAAAVTVETGLIEHPRRGVWLRVKVAGRDGAQVYDRRFQRIWDEIR